MIHADLLTLIMDIPKAENHIHFCGALEPATLLKLAERNKVPLPFNDLDGAKKMYQFSCLNEFLEAFSIACSTLKTSEDFATIAMDLGANAKRQNIVYREIMFTYQYHERNGLPLELVLEGLAEGKKRVEAEYGIKFRYIADIDRTISPENSLAYVEKLGQYKEMADIVAIGLDSQEQGYPAGIHNATFTRAKELGFKLTAHAGEDVGPESVWHALKDIHCDRIDHGVRAIEDEELLDYLVKNKIPMTVCPISNVSLKVYPELKEHPIMKLVNRGVVASINSDDPPFFFADLIDNYVATAEAFKLDKADIIKLVKNSFLASYLSDDEKLKYLAEIDKWS